jgi:multiple sugar transport system substrate-binding protein
MLGRFKRAGVLVTAAVLSVTVTVGLASAQPAAQSQAGAAARTLNIYGFGTGDDVANGRFAIASRAMGSGVDIDNPRGSFNDQAFLTMLASGNVPDLVYLDRALVGTYAARGAFQPLTNCLASQNINKSTYRKAALDQVTYRGTLYALPEFTNQITVIVNNDVAKAAGVNVADIQTTNWTKLKQANRKMLKIEGGKVTRIGFDPKIPEFFPLWVKWFGKDLISKDGLKAQLNSPEAVRALTYTVGLINDHGGWNKFKAFRDTWDFFGAGNQVAKNQVGAWPMESWYYNVLSDNSPNVDITAKYFTNRKGGPITFFQGSGWAIPRGARDADLACQFAKAMTATDTWRAVAKDRYDLRKRQNRSFTGLYTANTQADVKIYEDIYQKMGKPQFDNAVSLLVNSSRYAFALPPSPASNEFRQAYMDAINRVLARQQGVKAALDQAQREAQAAIDRNRR